MKIMRTQIDRHPEQPDVFTAVVDVRTLTHIKWGEVGSRSDLQAVERLR